MGELVSTKLLSQTVIEHHFKQGASCPYLFIKYIYSKVILSNSYLLCSQSVWSKESKANNSVYNTGNPCMPLESPLRIVGPSSFPILHKCLCIKFLFLGCQMVESS